MSLFDIFKKKKPTASEASTDIVVSKEKTNLIIEEFKSSTSLPSIYLDNKRGNVGLTDSKFGGQPYFPKDMEYPCDKTGKPLRLLAQLNWEDLPKLAHFPQKGILQFFIMEDNHYGANFDDMTLQDTFRIIYHPNILPECELTDNLPELSSDVFPLNGEFVLTAKIESCCMTDEDYRFEKSFAEICKKHLPNDTASFLDYNDDFTETVHEAISSGGHRIGGYPYIIQWDPRDEEAPYDILLLQIDSDFSDDKDKGILWGDGGAAHFFINSEDLTRLDFSNVIYHWDCS